MQAKLIVTFDRLSVVDFLAKSGAILDAITGNPHYPEPWAGPGLTLDQFKATYAAFQDAYHASLTRDTLKIAQRDAARQTLTDFLKRLALYLELIAQGDTILLATTGYGLRHDIVRNTGNELLSAPADFRVTHGQISGTLDVHVARLPSAGSYEIQTTQGDPAIDSNWQHAISSVTARHILITGLTPAQSYWLRMRGINSHGGGVWTDPVSIIVV